MRDPVEAYFTELRDVRATGGGVAETSYYGALATLLTEIGRGLKPKVRAVSQLKNLGAGTPDFGLFTQQQFAHVHDTEALSGQIPARGVVEVKGTSDNVFDWAKWPDPGQVPRYVERYGLVLVTNLRDFVLVGRGPDGEPILKESCRLAETEAGFWAKTQQPRNFAEASAEGLTEFLQRVLLHNAPLADPKDVAWFLASYARTARLRLEQKQELPALDQLRGQLENSLGLKFEGEKGDHFFRSTLVQTLFYGMFASWVLWARDRDHAREIPWDQRFQWETATATLHVPMVYELFRQFADVRQLGALGISEVLEWAEEVIWRIDRAAFFEKFREDHAVQYFYEPFLEAFDPQLRKELGVWYTPDEVVKYMVARVDTVLREEFGIADGLADESVVVLDPCCGTGAYLVEVLRKIDETLTAKGADALTRQDVKRAAMSRVIGFEIMPAPFVVAHLQMGILLAELGVPLRDADERAAIYLTNALTGWGDGAATPPKDKRVGEGQLHSTQLFPEFAEERDAADRVKREEQILVVIGNPPYNGFAGMAVDEERGLSDVYRTTKIAPKPRGQGLNDLYVRFYRVAERQIAERLNRGVVCLISNYSWLDGLSFTGFREKLLDEFTTVRVDCLNGDKYRTGKVTPQGLPDPSIFSTAHNREGIQVGTCIGTLVRSDGPRRILYRDLWGAQKLAQLSLDADDLTQVEYVELAPLAETGFTVTPHLVSSDYLSWPRLTELMPTSFPGVKTSNDSAVVATEKQTLESKFAERLKLVPGAQIIRYQYRPFDLRWLYWEPPGGLLDRPRTEFLAALGSGPFVEARQRQNQSFDRGGTVRHLADNLGNGLSSYFPLETPAVAGQLVALAHPLNISDTAIQYLRQIDAEPDAVFWHVVAVLNSPLYRRDHAAGLRLDWPRIPLPRLSDSLVSSRDLGCALGRLLDVDVTPELPPGRAIGTLSRVDSGTLDPAVDLGVVARWGVAGQGGVTMPSTGKLAERPYTADERAAIAESLGMPAEQAIGLLGETCFDVYLNDVAYWRCVPANVWRYTIGGYQVIKKWLSYRERALLGRDLKPEEARYVTEMVRRIAALVLMQPELDANYERVKADVWEWDDHSVAGQTRATGL